MQFDYKLRRIKSVEGYVFNIVTLRQFNDAGFDESGGNRQKLDELFTDITKSDFTKYANKIDVLTGGFPCQPYSQAYKQAGNSIVVNVLYKIIKNLNFK